MKNVFYFKKISSIGGCESWFYYLSRLYKNMVVYYKEGNPEQVKRLAHYVEVRKYKENEIINCENFFCCYNPDIVECVNAKMYAHVIHCDYKKVGFKPIMHPKFNKYIAVSKLAGESFKELTGIDYELLYNPVFIEPQNVEKYNDGKIHLISATRLTKEKGKERMKKLAKMFEEAGIDYEWEVYTNKHREPIGKNVVYKDPKFNILPEIAKADYLVQLSDCEAFCYSIVESLCVNTPVIVTDLPVLKELGVVDQKNAYICDFDMKNVPLNQIRQKSLKVAYKPPKSNWGKYLDDKCNYDPKDIIEMRSKRKIWLVEENIHTTRGNPVKLTRERASELECKDLVERI